MPSTKKRKFKRLFLAADLHGSEIVFRKFLGAAKFYEADALLIGGDKTAQTIPSGGGGRGGGLSTQPPGQVRPKFSAGARQTAHKKNRQPPPPLPPPSKIPF